MRPTIYSCLWWENTTSSPNKAGTSHALPRPFPSIYPGYNNGVSIENPILFAYPILPCYLPTLYSLVICLPYIHLYLLTLIPIPLLLAYLNPL